MEIVKGGAKKITGVVAAIKAELAELLTTKGLPDKVYLVVLTKAPSPVWLKENGVTCSAIGMPIPSTKTGQVMYNFQGKGLVNGEDMRIGGNAFLKDIFVDKATAEQYAQGKKDQALAFEASKAKRGQHADSVKVETVAVVTPELSDEELAELELEAGEKVA